MMCIRRQVWPLLAAAMISCGCSGAVGPDGGHGWTLATGDTGSSDSAGATQDGAGWPGDPTDTAVGSDAGTLDGAPTDTPDGASPDDAAAPAAWQGLVINEVDNKGAPEDWFELYNGRAEALDLGGVRYLDKDTPDATAAVFPTGTTLPAGGYLQVFCGDASAGFKLGVAESLTLWAPDGSVIDQVSWDQGTDGERSWGRVPDGGEVWQVLDPGTPGKSNGG